MGRVATFFPALMCGGGMVLAMWFMSRGMGGMSTPPRSTSSRPGDAEVDQLRAELDRLRHELHDEEQAPSA